MTTRKLAYYKAMSAILVDAHERITGADHYGEFTDLRDFLARKARLAREHVRMHDSMHRW